VRTVGEQLVLKLREAALRCGNDGEKNSIRDDGLGWWTGKNKNEIKK